MSKKEDSVFHGGEATRHVRPTGKPKILIRCAMSAWIVVALAAVAASHSTASGIAHAHPTFAKPPSMHAATHGVAFDGSTCPWAGLPTLPGIPQEEPEPTPEPTGPPPLDPNRPMIALTFDDGPSPTTVPLLDVLVANGAHATFFVVGNRVQNYADAARAIVTSGSEIMGHSWGHGNLAKMSPEQIANDLLGTSTVIQQVTGVVPLAYRPPYGVINAQLKDVSAQVGQSLIMWNVDTEDWKSRDAQAVHDWIMGHAEPNSIVLCHDLYDSTVQGVAAAIPELIAAGYQLVTVSELLALRGIPMQPGAVYSHG